MSAILHFPYFKSPQPDILFPSIVAAAKTARSSVNLGINSMILFLLIAHPDKAEQWEQEHKWIIKKAREVVASRARENNQDFVGWNDYYMGEWLILGSDSAMAQIRYRYGLVGDAPGSVGYTARWMVKSMMTQCPEFYKAFFR